METDVLIVGAGITGLTLANRFAGRGRTVTVIEARDHIGGNCHDVEHPAGITVQQYGPHIFHTQDQAVWAFLSRFTAWNQYRHKVLARTGDMYLPIPFNFNALETAWGPSKARPVREALLAAYGEGARVPILDLRSSADPVIAELAAWIYDHLFAPYTRKQWGLLPEDLDPAVIARVPVKLSADDSYFDDAYQGLPARGFSALFKGMIAEGNIQVLLQTPYDRGRNEITAGLTVYTGRLDEYFEGRHGPLAYRGLRMDFKELNQPAYQPAAVVNYPDRQEYTRSTEFKKLYQQTGPRTVIGFEYPGPDGVPAWPVLNPQTRRIRAAYQQEAEALADRNIFFAGRLARFEYLNMDSAVRQALDLFETLKDRA